MGASVSLYQTDQLPPVIEQTHFIELTDNKFTPAAYDAFADHNGKVSRARMLEVISNTDYYLSHEWGIDNEGRNTSDRVRKIHEYLFSKGLFATFDEGQISGMSYFDMVKNRIHKAQCVILCMTERYFYQLQSSIVNSSQLEFYECMNKRDHRIVIPLVMERAAFAIPEFITSHYPQFTFKTHLDFTTFADIGADDADMLRDLSLYISKCIRPLREGGSYKQQRNQFFTTVAGRHYKWLIANNPKFGHDLAMKYANLFAEHDIESTSRLWQMLQHDKDFLLKIKIPGKDAVQIRNALKADLQANFDTINAKLIDKKIAEQNRINEDELRGHLERTAVAIDMKTKFTELKLMSQEDEFSRNFREECRMEKAHNAYVQGRQELLYTSEHQHAKYHKVLHSMRELQKQRIVDNDRAWRSEEFLHIGRYSEPAEASGALYRLFIKIDRATAHLQRDNVYLDNPEDTEELLQGYRDNDQIKRTRVQAFIERAMDKMTSRTAQSKEGPTAAAKEEKQQRLVVVAAPDSESSFDEEQNSRLIFLIQEAAYICRSITDICHNNPGHVHQFAEGGVVKLLMALLSQVYLFSCQFESLFMPMSFHYLAMPTEALLAMRYLVKCGVGRRHINTKVGFLFVEAGAMELCLEVIRFHLNDMNIASIGIELLFVLVDVPGASAAHVRRLMENTSHLLLLIVVMEKYSEYFSPAALNLHSCIIGTLSHVMLAQEYDAQLRVYRGHLLTPIFCAVLSLVDQSSDLELCTRLCVCIANFWYRPEYENSHFFTSEFIPKKKSFAREICSHVNYRVALRFLKKAMVHHFANDVLVLAALVALGNIIFNNDKMKQEAFKMKIHETVAKILRDRMSRLDRIAHTSATVDEIHEVQEQQEQQSSLHITREVLFEGLISACNFIIVPPFLTYDTLSPEHNVGLTDEIQKTSFKAPDRTATAAATGEVKMAAGVSEEGKSALCHYVDVGIAELVMNIVTNYMHDRVLIRSMLIFVNKFVYRGRYLSTSRLVKLGFCEQVRNYIF